MVSSRAATIPEYLAALAPDRREVVSVVRDLVNRSLPAGFEEGMQYGMIGWYVPLSRYPDTYNGQPLGIVALAAQKSYLSLYLDGGLRQRAQRRVRARLGGDRQAPEHGEVLRAL